MVIFYVDLSADLDSWLIALFIDEMFKLGQEARITILNIKITEIVVLAAREMQSFFLGWNVCWLTNLPVGGAVLMVSDVLWVDDVTQGYIITSHLSFRYLLYLVLNVNMGFLLL